MIINLTIKEAYGKELIYPETYGKELLTLTRQKTLTREQIKALKSMGFTFKVLQPEVNL